MRRALRDLQGRAKATSVGSAPLVSVVVTTSDLDVRFLDECLDSLRQQSYDELDVIISFWGSASDVRVIARRHAQQDVRFTYLTSEARDRGEAQSRGAEAARGEFLQFIRGEDVVPVRAVGSLVQSLLESGSDIAVGRRSHEVQLTRRVREARDPLHETPAKRATMSTCPAVVTNLGLENRMYRKTFWITGKKDWATSSSPTAEVVLRSHLSGSHFDIVDAVAYRDMNRAVGVPVGALNDPLAGLPDWLVAQHASFSAVSRVDDAEVSNYWVASVLDGELQHFIERVETATDSQWQALSVYTVQLLDLVPAALARVRAESRVKVELLRLGRRQQLEEFLAARWFENGNKPTVVEASRVFAELPGFRDPDWALPDELFEMTDAETGLEVVLRDVSWTDAQTLDFQFFVWIDFVNSPAPLEVEVVLVDPDTGTKTPLAIAQSKDPAVNHLAEHRYQDYSHGSVRLSVPIETLLLEAITAPRRWQFEFSVVASGLHRVGGVTRRDERGAGGLLTSRLLAPRQFDNGQVCVEAGGVWAAEVSALPPGTVRLVAGRITGRRLVGTCVARGEELAEVQAVGPRGVTIRSELTKSPDGWAFELNLPALRDASGVGRAVWGLRVVTHAGEALPIAWPASWVEQWSGVGDGSVVLSRSIGGKCELLEAADALVIDHCDLLGDATPRLVITSRWLGSVPAQAELTLTSNRSVVSATRQSGTGNTVHWTFDLKTDEWGRGPATLPAGRYILGLRCGAQPGALHLAGGLIAKILEVEDTPAYSWRLFRGTNEIGVLLSRPLAAGDRGPYNQRQLQLRCVENDEPLDEQAVYLQSYNGASATDSQLAIHHELRRRHPDWTLYWGIHDRSSWVPEGARSVVMNSAEWYAALSTSRYLVNNIDFDRWFTPREGQQFLQTFHGYPAKSMGIRLWEAKSFSPRRISAELARTADQWDVILTPTPEMDEHYRREYRYDGEIVNQGYPRDDELLGVEAPQIRHRTRALLGIQPEQTVVLYAPTWRDDLATNYRKAEMAQHIDLEDASAELGNEFVFLMRGHRFHGKSESRQFGSARLIDVTHYPEINDLILASDAAVLDYSSLRFDFALTRKPMLFLVPDLASYTGSVRGFLYDFAPSAPGPLLETPDQVVARLKDLPAVSRDFAAAYSLFHERFNYLQDGHATERVVSRFFA